jgi:homoserine dehydrogenase
VDGVFNAILVKGNMVGDVMFYGQGAGKLATASAVVSDVMDAAKHAGVNIITLWDSEKLDLVETKDAKNRFFVRAGGSCPENAAKVQAAFGTVEQVDAGFEDEYAFITQEITEGQYEKAAQELGNIINKIRIDKAGL